MPSTTRRILINWYANNGSKRGREGDYSELHPRYKRGRIRGTDDGNRSANIGRKWLRTRITNAAAIASLLQTRTREGANVSKLLRTPSRSFCLYVAHAHANCSLTWLNDIRARDRGAQVDVSAMWGTAWIRVLSLTD